jgi:hypothetical protein
MRKRMKAGLELDIKIVKNVLKYELMPTIYYKDLDTSKKYYCICGSPESEEVNIVEYVYSRWLQYDFLPSINMSHAWQVVEKLDHNVTLEKFNTFTLDFNNTKQVEKYEYRATVWCEGHRGVSYEEETAPLAICLASLKAKGIDI